MKMMFTCFQSTMWLVWFLSFYSCTESRNMSKIMELYINACGDHLCDTRILPKSQKDSDDEEFCPTCSCEHNCIYEKNCCPDFFFSFNQSCVNTHIINFDPYSSSKSVAMIKTCPENSDKKIKSLCEIGEDIQDQLQNIPVSSVITGLTYRNRYCSKCSNDPDIFMIEWSMVKTCVKFADFNFVSSFTEFVDYAKDRECNVFFSSEIPDENINFCNDPVDQDVIRTCNVSGTWQSYDADIDFACRMYENKFRSFKNIFCYMCNPPSYKGEVISECRRHITPSTFSTALEKLCVESQQSPVTFPFKNIFCYMCNNDKALTKYGRHFFKEMTTVYNESFENPGTFVMKFVPEYLNRNWLPPNMPNYSNIQNTDNVKDTENAGIENRLSSNVTNLLQKAFSLTGEANFCHNYSIFNPLSTCDCSDDCYFTSGRCCFDKQFQKGPVCTDTNHSLEEKGYLVYQSCSKAGPLLLKTRCEETNKSDLFSFLPVEMHTNDTVFHYKNIYCGLCNEEPRDYPQSNPYSSPVRLWKLIIKCNVYLPSYFYTSFEEFYKFSLDNGCLQIYEPHTNIITCERKDKNVCNETGEWQNYDSDVQFACENSRSPSYLYTSYKQNIFCLICNPRNGNRVNISKCNETGIWHSFLYNSYDEENCLNMPLIENYAPYKNIFCSNCNGVFTVPDFKKTTIIYPIDDNRDPGYIMPTFREIFAFSNFKNGDLNHNDGLAKCNSNQTFLKDIDECRDLVCYPGRMLIESNCVPLLQRTTNLGYTLYLGLNVELLENVDDAYAFLKSLLIEFQDFLMDFLGGLYVHFESAYLLSNLTCERCPHWKKGENVKISLYQKLFISKEANRSFIEEQLVHLSGNIYNASNNSFVIFYDQNAFKVPSLISKLQHTNRCFLKDINSIANAEKYIHSPVNQLLLCTQIELYKHEYRLDKQSLLLTILNNGQSINHDAYLLTSEGKARICLEKLKDKPINQDTSQDIWKILQFICTIISLLCLFVTFCTYCLFENLRSLPGKNNMSLIFAIFFAQLTFQFVTFGAKFVIACKVIGILVHYFWLAMFGCFNVCSFHMYRVFSSKTGIKISERSNLIIYNLYSYGVPALIICLNVLVTSTASKDSSIGYGGHICFVNELVAFIVTFILPLSLICCSNIFFFIVTTYKIINRPKLKTDTKMQANQVQFAVYVKLFIITGISWILQIVDSFITMSAFSIIISLLNTLQGVFIFLSYICNKRVLSLYKNMHVLSRRNFHGFARSENSTTCMTTEFNSRTD